MCIRRGIRGRRFILARRWLLRRSLRLCCSRLMRSRHGYGPDEVCVCGAVGCDVAAFDSGEFAGRSMWRSGGSVLIAAGTGGFASGARFRCWAGSAGRAFLLARWRGICDSVAQTDAVASGFEWRCDAGDGRGGVVESEVFLCDRRSIAGEGAGGGAAGGWDAAADG